MRPLDALIGVVDLKHGQAVHAIAGNRDQYLPLAIANKPAGDALALLVHYYSLGLRRFYLADLNALCGLASQQTVIADLLRDLPAVAPETSEVFLDEGAIHSQYTTGFPLRRVIATEANRTADDWLSAASNIPAEHLVLGLDLDGTRVRTANPIAEQASDLLDRDLLDGDLLDSAWPWLQAARTAGCRTVLALDLRFVGTQQGIGTTHACQRLSSAEPGFQWLSGGGVRTGDDVQQLLAAGCSGVLIGTALHRDPQARRVMDAVGLSPPAR